MACPSGLTPGRTWGLLPRLVNVAFRKARALGRLTRVRAWWDRLPIPPQHVVPLVIGLLLPRRRALPRRAVPLGVCLLLDGTAVNVWAVLARGGGDLEHPAVLVTDGPYAFSRNPMYVGWSLIHLGAGLAARSPWVLASWLYPLSLLHRGVLAEERMLVEEFGEEFEEYAAQVPRYLGLRPGSRR